MAVHQGREEEGREMTKPEKKSCETCEFTKGAKDDSNARFIAWAHCLEYWGCHVLLPDGTKDFGFWRRNE